MRGVTFIIPFRSKATCRDWEAVSGALRGTLASIANQSASGYRCILACHEPPDGFVARPWLAVVEVSSPRPAGPAEYKGDKRAKLVAGLREYLRDPTELYMILDADDRVHAELARHVGGADAPTYLVDKGYVYAGGRWLRAHNGTFDRLCGSTCVSNREDAATGFVPSKRMFPIRASPQESTVGPGSGRFSRSQARAVSAVGCSRPSAAQRR